MVAENTSIEAEIGLYSEEYAECLENSRNH